MLDGDTAAASYKMKLSSSVDTQVPLQITQTQPIWTISGRLIQSPWNGAKSKRSVMCLRLAPTAPSTTISKIIASSYSEEAGPIRSDITQSISLIGKVKNGGNWHPNKINPPPGRELTIRLNYSRTTSSLSEGRELQILKISGYSTSRPQDGLRLKYPRIYQDHVPDGFIPRQY